MVCLIISIYVICFAFLTYYTRCDDPKSFNFAAHSAGAVVIEKSPASAKGFHNLLNDDKDKYGICSSKDDKWVVIGLSEDVLITSVTIATYEKYSSVIREFHLLASPVYPTLEWIKLGKFIAEPRLGEQMFNIVNVSGAHTRYMKLEILSHHFDEELFTISQIKVHGLSFMASLKQEVELSNQDMMEKWNHLQQDDADTQSNKSVDLTNRFPDSQSVENIVSSLDGSFREDEQHKNSTEYVVVESQDNTLNEQQSKGQDVDQTAVSTMLPNTNLSDRSLGKNQDHFNGFVKRDEKNETIEIRYTPELEDNNTTIVENTTDTTEENQLKSNFEKKKAPEGYGALTSDTEMCRQPHYAYYAMSFEETSIFPGFHLSDAIPNYVESNQMNSNDTFGPMSTPNEKVVLKNISNCLESLRFGDFKAKMLEKLNFSVDDNSLHHSSLYKENVFRSLVHRIINLEMNERITEKFMIQVSFKNLSSTYVFSQIFLDYRLLSSPDERI